MTLNELRTVLESVVMNGELIFDGKVAYRAFPENDAPELPFICYQASQTENFKADNSVYQKRQGIDIELYTQYKDEDVENALEDVLNASELLWEKYEEYIDSEKMYQITYEVII